MLRLIERALIQSKSDEFIHGLSIRSPLNVVERCGYQANKPSSKEFTKRKRPSASAQFNAVDAPLIRR